MILPANYNPVAYFCSEFAIDSDLPTYAGGLGILAGDYMNTCATDHFHIVGIGILYKGKHFVQEITSEGKEIKRDSEFDHDTSFLRPTTIKGKAVKIPIDTPDGEVLVKAYHIRLSDESLQFFLTTDVDTNPDPWRHDMDTLYSGDAQSQMRQMILLGVGGVKLLETLNIKPRLYHFNEGRPIFAKWELVHSLVDKNKLSFEEAWKEITKKTIYTNHTLVAAGNPAYDVESVEWAAGPFANKLGVAPYELVKDGVENDRFSITTFALNNSVIQQAVSKVHGDYCKRDYPNFNWSVITNGVHMYRWQDSEFRNTSMTNRQLWDQHMFKKRELLDTVNKRTGLTYDPQQLVISWARRLAAYKQPTVIFSDLEKLKSIVESSGRNVQILFAGNSHSADPGSKKLIDEVISLFSNELSGYAIFIPNYNISLANHMVSGSDVWLNTPQGNLEACGTSGMKAIANGVLNCTVLDGWTYEVDWNGIGWTLDPNNTADSFYSLLEKEIIPAYYELNDQGLPEKWITRMRKSIELANNYSSVRMLEEYKTELYDKIN